MAEENIPFAVTDITVPGASIEGPLGATLQRLVSRPPVNAGASNTPVERPVALLDARFVARAAVPSDPADVATAPGECEVEFNEADGEGTGSMSLSPMVPGNFDAAAGHNEEGGAEFEYVMLGTELSVSTSV